MEEETKKKSKKPIIILVILGILLLVGGGVLTYLTSPKYITTSVIKEMSENVTNLINQEDKTGLEENFKTTGTIKFDLQSDYFQSLSTMDPTYASIANLLKNLTNTENNITIVQDKKNKNLFVNYDSKLSGQPLINTKYLVNNATEYYYIDGITNSYINNGNNNYFESLNSSTTTIDNTKYMIEKIQESLSNNIKEEYLSESYQDQYKVITMTLTEDNFVELANNILKDLKNDTKANQIMTSLNKDFSKKTITKKDVSGMKTIKFNIYVNKLLPRVMKYELKTDDKNSIIYSKENNQNVVEIHEGESLTKLEITTQDEKTEVKITDDKNNDLGSISISKTDTNYDVIAKIITEDMNIDIGYNYQMTNLKKSTSYDSTATISLNIAAKQTTILDGTVTMKMHSTNDTTITEDVSNSALASTLTSNQQELMNQKITTVLTQLMS
ncbi:MAG TPA: hypothetical protein IAB35_03635 [Candidatus Faecimonas gallistercoris]|nr:hypothetical protein [Candidatus Faecimonas gallistercoris]